MYYLFFGLPSLCLFSLRSIFYWGIEEPCSFSSLLCSCLFCSFLLLVVLAPASVRQEERKSTRDGRWCATRARKIPNPKDQKPGIFFPRPLLLLLLLLSLRPFSAFYLVGVCYSGILCVTSRHGFLRDSVGGRNLAVSSSRYKVFIIGTRSMEEGERRGWRRN
jgi:hypothetical protein